MIHIYCADRDKKYTMSATTPIMAMQKLLYTLNIVRNDTNAAIEVTAMGNLALRHHGSTYWCETNQREGAAHEQKIHNQGNPG